MNATFRLALNAGQTAPLLSNPSWPEFRDQALCYAAAECSVDVVKTLITHGANPIYEQDAPLYMAADNNNVDVVRFLLTIPAVSHLASSNKNRSLFAAQLNECQDIEDLLMELPNVSEGPSLRKPAYGLI